MDSYADDALTDALLAAGTVNVEEYGKQGQVILSDTLNVDRNNNQASQQTKQPVVQSAYNSQGETLKNFLTDQAGNITWKYPEYTLQQSIQGQQNEDSQCRIVQNYGIDYQQVDSDGKATRVDSQDSNYNKVQYQVFKDSTDGGYYENEWIQSKELDDAFLAFIKNLQSNTESFGQGIDSAKNSQLAKTYDNFLTTFGWDFGLSEVDGYDTSKMTYKNFKYSGGRLGNLTDINKASEQYKSPIYIDYISVFNVYKHYISLADQGYIYYPQKTDAGEIYITVGDSIYKLDQSDQRVQKLYEICKENGLAGTPIYDKIIVTKQVIQRNDQDGTTQIKYNNLSENHVGVDSAVIQSVDFLDPSIFVLNTENKTASLDSQMNGYIDQLLNSKLNVYDTNNGYAQKYQIGISKIAEQYPQTQGNSDIGRASAKNYPNPTMLTYQITSSPNKGVDGSLTHNKQNIVVFNQAVMAQVEFDVQMMNPDSMLTGDDDNVRTAYYQRIIDITIQPPALSTIQ